MAAQAGANMLLKISNEDSPETFATVAGIRTTSLSINREPIDITDQQSANRWREYLAQIATKSISVSGAGVFQDDGSGDTSLKNAALDETAMQRFQCVVPDFGTFEGSFHITSFEYSGEHTDAVQFSISLESGGAITFTAT
ncbi:MAG: phage major tail protein, TP901-1 family [Pseudomonadota bacterium]|nr:phage major tail protein, TP901-1 family [Pseudomonadota bacterium]